jgi:outer membrane protein assembly factor BamA
MVRQLTCMAVLLFEIQAQNTAFPLESVSLEGTQVSKEVVMGIAGLRIGFPIDTAAIETACTKIKESGVFESVRYRYGPGPRRGYVLNLMVSDPATFLPAAIDFPGSDESELWQWLSSQFPAFNHRVPANDTAQLFLSKKLEEHVGAKLDGQHVVTRVESDLTRGRTIVSFQPETLPRIASMNFTGQHALASEELVGLLEKIVGDEGYTDRHFRSAVEMNIRRAYEERGMYRVRFPSITTQKPSPSAVIVTTVVEEGPQYTLGGVALVGDNLPTDAMLEAAKFKTGQIAKWNEIQQAIWESEKPLKRTGYFEAASKPERVLHDDTRVLDLRVSYNLGPFYHFGQLRLMGLPSNLEAQARKIWKLQAGDPFDYDYAREFFRDFFKSVDSRQFKKVNASFQGAAGDHVMDFTLLFEPK